MNTGVNRRKLPLVSRQVHEIEFHEGRVREPKSHEAGVQTPLGFHSEESEKGAVRAVEAASYRVLAAEKESRVHT